MALRQTLNETGRVVRRVSVVDNDVTVVDDDEPWMPARFRQPADDQPTDDESPRERPPTTLSYVEGFRSLAGMTSLRAGDRVERKAGEVYELLSDPKEVRNGSLVEGYSAPTLPTSVLYPSSAVLEAQGGQVLVDPVPCAIWGGSGLRESAGEYEDLEGETPVEFASVIKTNTQLRLNGVLHRLTDSTVDLTGPRVKLSLRRPRG